MALKSFQDVQAFFDSFVKRHGIDISDSPHVDFWVSDYDAFVNGDVPNVLDSIGQPVKILVSGNSKDSLIIQVLQGTASDFRQMPGGGPYMSAAEIQELADWIDHNCPK